MIRQDVIRAFNLDRKARP